MNGEWWWLVAGVALGTLPAAIIRLLPVRTVESVAREIIEGLEDGTVVWPDDFHPVPDDDGGDDARD